MRCTWCSHIGMTTIHHQYHNLFMHKCKNVKQYSLSLIRNIPWTLSSKNIISIAQRYQLWQKHIYIYSSIMMFFIIKRLCEQYGYQHSGFSCLPYANDFLEIHFQCSIHIIIKVEFWMSPAVFLPKTDKKNVNSSIFTKWIN